MDYEKHTTEDFVLDPKFRKWVLNPDKATVLFWETWAKNHPDKVVMLKEARDLLLNLPGDQHFMSEGEIDDLWSKIELQIDEKTSNATPESKVIPMNARVQMEQADRREKGGWDYQIIGKIAASVFICICIGLSLYLGSTVEEPKPMPAVVKKETSLGQRSTIFLSDGTEVKLNAGSSIEYVKGFTENERRVILQGEAYFNVAKDENRPFRVITGNIVTEALGTAFNVEAYDPNLVKVALESGKVLVDRLVKEGEPSSIILHPGEEARCQVNKELKKSHFDPKLVLSWKDGYIYFKNASEGEVFKALERWYGVKIIKKNQSTKIWDYTGSFKNQSLEHVLMSIGYSMDFDFRIDQKAVELKYKN